MKLFAVWDPRTDMNREIMVPDNAVQVLGQGYTRNGETPRMVRLPEFNYLLGFDDLEDLLGVDMSLTDALDAYHGAVGEERNS